MDEGIKFTQAELDFKNGHNTSFYQDIAYPKLETMILDRAYRIGPACTRLGIQWHIMRSFLTGQQKEDIQLLAKKYARNKRRRRKIGTSASGAIKASQENPSKSSRLVSRDGV